MSHPLPTHSTLSSLSLPWKWFTSTVILGFIILTFGLGSTLPGCSMLSHRKPEPIRPGDYTWQVTHDHRDRSYLVHLPPQANTKKPLPLVLNFHGGGGHAAQHQGYTELDRVADTEGFIVVYPNGTGPLSSRLLTWNAGSCCGYAAKNGVDDVGFIRALIEDMKKRLPIDTQRLYATGLSNGAMMAYRLAAEAPDLVTAIAPIAGSMALPHIPTQGFVPVMHVHSLDDPHAPYDGGWGLPFPLTRHQEHHFPVESQLAHWIDQNQCSQQPVKTPMLHGGEGTPEAHHTAQKITYSPCQTGADVWLWQLSGPGHVWPGGSPTPFQRFLGPQTSIIQVNQEMWIFFSRYPR